MRCQALQGGHGESASELDVNAVSANAVTVRWTTAGPACDSGRWTFVWLWSAANHTGSEIQMPCLVTDRVPLARCNPQGAVGSHSR